MTATDLFNEMIVTGVTTRENLDTFFFLLSSDTLDNQIAMTLRANDLADIYYTINDVSIKVISE